MPRDKYSGLRAAYAEAHGLDRRTAQRHSKNKDPRWLAWIGETAVEGVKRKNSGGTMEKAEATALASISPLAPVRKPSFYDQSDSELDPVQIHEKQAWEVHSRMFAQWEDAVGSPGKDVLAGSLARELPALQSAYWKAVERRTEWEQRQRRVIERHEFDAFVARVIVPMAALLRSLPTELATITNPEKPEYARKQLLDWRRQRAEPHIREMLEGAEEFVTV